MSIADTVDEAAACYAAGACAIHAHVRGENDEHVLDAGRYRELIAEINHRVPEMLVQITSEAVGIYSPEQQVECIQAVKPAKWRAWCCAKSARISPASEYARDFFASGATTTACISSTSCFPPTNSLSFSTTANAASCRRTAPLRAVRARSLQRQFPSDPADLEPFLQHDLDGLDWFTCAFGEREQDCVLPRSRPAATRASASKTIYFLPDGDGRGKIPRRWCGALAQGSNPTAWRLPAPPKRVSGSAFAARESAPASTARRSRPGLA